VTPLKRINIRYDGDHYTLANRKLSDVQNEITTAILAGQPLWLRVNHGEGSYQPADLLITASTPISLMGVELPPTDHVEDEKGAEEIDALEIPEDLITPIV
jgi:hypothetical protein